MPRAVQRAAHRRSGDLSISRVRTVWRTYQLWNAPIFIADSVSLAVSREKDGKLRIVYAGWDNANVVQPGGYGQARSGWSGESIPLPGEALTPPPKNEDPPPDPPGFSPARVALTASDRALFRPRF